MSSGGATSGVDAGPPLEQSRDVFCSGRGPVVDVGAGGNASVCAGDLAEQTFRFALCACDNIQVGSQLEVDAFDSRLGSYGAALDGGGVNMADDGQLGTNGGALTLSNKLTVRGSAFIGGGGIQVGPSSVVSGNLYAYGAATEATNTSLTVGRNAFIHGNVTSAYTIQGDLTVPPGATVAATVNGTTTQQDFAQTPPCPCEPSQRLDVGALTALAATRNDNGIFDGGAFATQWEGGNGPTTLSLPCGRYYVTSIVQSTQLNLTAEGRVALFVDGNLEVSGISITVAEGAELDLFVKGNVVISSSASFGNQDAPSSVRVYVGGNMNLQASAVFAGNVYAPNANVTFSASSNLYGSLFVNSVNFGASANIHFDTAVRSAGSSCVPPPVDGGVVTVDGGETVDAGESADAGPPACTNVCDPICGVLACGSTGMCRACTSDLDCCAPAVCDVAVGQCILSVGG